MKLHAMPAARWRLYGQPRREQDRKRRRRLPVWPLVLALMCACSSTSRPPPLHPAASTGHVSGKVQRGYATWYGESQMTASGERYDKHALTAAHRTLPFGTRVRVTNERNGMSIEVRINDRGPFGKSERIIDLSESAARALHMIDDGVVPVALEVVR